MIEIVKAYLEGKTIEYREKHHKDAKWGIKAKYNSDISFYPDDFEYRIQPEVIIRYVLPAHFEEAIKANNFCLSKPYLHTTLPDPNVKRIKLTFTDNELTKAEVM